ncbi:MAG: phosphatidylglycerophosphatase A [Deltaproteobacteria bacterium]|nr:phosphatidylglycerophosphatase A [Deltaproteobacteria bacterium]
MNTVSKRLTLFFATGAYSGYVPVMPGTVGTLVGILVFLPLAGLALPLYAAVSCAVIVFSIVVSGRAEQVLGKKDPGAVVIDEIAGYLVTMATFPADWRYLAIGFVLFRVMDIWKPFPANLANDRVHGGLGIVLDDLIAGVYANLCLQVIRMVW